MILRARILWDVRWRGDSPSFVVSVPYAEDARKSLEITVPLSGGPYANSVAASKAATAQMNAMSDAELAGYIA